MGLSEKHKLDLQKYVDYYKGEIYGTGWPGSIACAIKAALNRIDELEREVTELKTSGRLK
jgi:hypothetical protein